MKLYLSSYRLGDSPQKFAELVGINKKVALISNSLDFSTDIARLQESAQREINDLKAIGLNPKKLDFRDYFDKPEELKAKLQEFGAVWVRGGNVFILRRAYKQSGFDKWLIEQKDNKDFVYGGYSAGVCVLSPSLKGLELVDDLNITAEGYEPEVIWDGVGLIDFAFAPHYKSNHPETEMIDKAVEWYIQNKVNYKSLHDGEVIIQET